MGELRMKSTRVDKAHWKFLQLRRALYAYSELNVQTDTRLSCLSTPRDIFRMRSLATKAEDISRFLSSRSRVLVAIPPYKLG